jgi:hypothetical protein
VENLKIEFRRYSYVVEWNYCAGMLMPGIGLLAFLLNLLLNSKGSILLLRSAAGW